MRDFTYFAGARFGIANLFRSQRFNIDRLDINWVDDEVPAPVPVNCPVIVPLN